MSASKLFREAADFENQIKPTSCWGKTVKAYAFLGVLVLLFVTSVSEPVANFAMERNNIALYYSE